MADVTPAEGELPHAEDPSGLTVHLVRDDVRYEHYARVLSRQVRYPRGELVDFDLWSKNWRNENRFAQVVPYDSATNSFTMIREYAPAPHAFLYAFPGGNVEGGKHRSAEHAIATELAEEAALGGGNWHALLDGDEMSVPQDKYQVDRIHMYLVVDARPLDTKVSAHKMDEEELIVVCAGVSAWDFLSFVQSGRVQANCVACGLLAIRRLETLGYTPFSR